MNPKPTPPHLLYPAVVLLLVAFSIGLTALVSRSVYERLPHLEDEMAYLWQARALNGGQPVLASPDPARPFWQPFVVDRGGQRFGKYPLGWPLLLSVGTALGQAWWVNAWLAALTVALAYRWGREIFYPETGVIAAALTAFSPMALLLNGTLMGHTAALFSTTLFFYAYWRLERGGRQALRWGALAGVALGLTVINRPLAGVAVAAPFVLWSAIKLLRVLPFGWAAVMRTLAPLLALGGLTVAFALAIPAYNAAATGDPRANLYLLVWPYDRVGFGEGYGRNGHTLEKGLRQTRWDLSLAAADLFGWQVGGMPPETDRLRLSAVYWPAVGLSAVLLPLGVALGLRRRAWVWAAWFAFGVVIYAASTNLPVNWLRDRDVAVVWMAGAGLWFVLPFAALFVGTPDRRAVWTALLLAVPVGLIVLYIAYWIGSQLYSTRYYYEALTACALLTAVPLGALAARGRAWRWTVGGALTAALLVSLYGYSMPRIQPLYRFNWVSPALIEAVEARREGARPVLVLIRGSDVRWRAFGALMASTSPFLDSPIVAAWDNGGAGVREGILALFPDRQVVTMTADHNRACFGDDLSGECFGEPPA